MLLERIHSPADVKTLPDAQLTDLAQEIREYIKETVMRNGGHLSSNLGTVELTLALHRAFTTPQDKLVWDVGHQSYTHKIITGRREAFAGIRTQGGLSGFPKPQESEHDSFIVGHSSTSISAALGMARARDLRGDDHSHVVAIIGDGALTGGMALEALNDVGRSKTRLIIILNDNEMSIQRNVGALSEYLFSIRARRSYQNAKNRIKLVLKRDSFIRKVAESTRNRLRYLLLRGNWFEEIGIKYIGPFDGHQIEHLSQALNIVKQFDSPVLLHVRTCKGKGDAQAEANPEKYHGLTPAGKGVNGFAYSSIIGRAVSAMAAKDDLITAIAAAMPFGCGLEEFFHNHPRRFFDVGIAEEHAVTMAAGMAKEGFKPVVAIYSTFLQRAYDQILHDVCISNLPVVFFVCSSGITGEDGETHQGVFSLSFLLHLPNMRVFSPTHGGEIHPLLCEALNGDGPVAILLPKGKPVNPEEGDSATERWYSISNGGRVAFLAYSGTMITQCYRAAAILKKEGVAADVWHCPHIKPLDADSLAQIMAQYERVITVEDNMRTGGFGAYVMEAITPETRHKLHCLAIGDHFLQHATIEYLINEQHLSGEHIARQVLEVLP